MVTNKETHSNETPDLELASLVGQLLVSSNIEAIAMLVSIIKMLPEIQTALQQLVIDYEENVVKLKEAYNEKGA